jgi:TIR domain
METTPTVFLCHAHEDKPTARRLAESFRAEGIEVFFDEWEIGAGDSLRQKIDQGLERCTHFVALLSPVSIQKAWVKTEMDAGFILRLQGRCRFIPLRLDLDVAALPPTLCGLLSPALTDSREDLKRLIHDIHGLSRKPPLGPPPASVRPAIRETYGLSPCAAKIAGEFLKRSTTGRHGDPQMEVEELLEATELLEDDLAEGVEELKDRGLVGTLDVGGCALGYFAVEPTSRFFAELDASAMEWRPEEDAVRLAAELINAGGYLYLPKAIEEIGWQPRRANPALTYLIERRLVDISNENSWPLVSDHIDKNPKTRRFVQRDAEHRPPGLAVGSRDQGNSLSFFCLHCGSSEFTRPENPTAADTVTCSGCGAAGTHGDLRAEMGRQAKEHIDEMFGKALGPLFKRS